MYPEDRLKQIELAYEIGPDWWNQGYMTEAVKRVLDYFSVRLALTGFMPTMLMKTLLPAE